jgi:hypothetical protein
LDTVHYEIDMLEYALAKTTKPELPPPELNMRLECFLLHYRNLIEFFSGKKHRKNGTDISVARPEVWCGRALKADERDAMVTSATELMDEYWEDISQFLQHCTQRRFLEARDWDPQKMSNRLKPATEYFRKAFPRTDSRNGGFVLGPSSASTATLIVGSTRLIPEE